MIKEAGLDVLNCGMGHLEIRFNAQDVIELERAKRIIQDMLRRGYALFINDKDGKLTRVKNFISETGTYIIADGPSAFEQIVEEEVPAKEPEPWKPSVVPASETEPDPPPEPPKNRPGRPRKAERSVPMTQTKATVVGRSAGG